MRLPFTRRGKKRKSLPLKALAFVLVPITVFFAFAFVFFLSDDFWLLAQMTVLRGNEGNPNGVYTPSNGTGQGGSGASGLSPSYGSNGLNLMLMNSMTGGYCADWLTLARDHCNRKYMFDEVKFPNDVNPSIVIMTGTAMKETGLQKITLPNGTTAKVPTSTINLDVAEYGSTLDGGCSYTLLQVSSEFLKNNKGYVNKSFASSFKSSSSGYYGTFQMSSNMLSRNPDNPNGSASGNYPSKLVGFGMDATRSTTNGDFGFFPDQMSSNLQSCWSRWASNYKGLGGKHIDFSREMAVGLGYAATNAGEGNVANWFGLGTWSGGVGDHKGQSNTCAAAQAYPSGEARGECVADAMNQLMDAGDKVMNYIMANPELMSESLYLDRKTFQGITAAATLYGCKSGFVTSTNKDRLQNDMSGNNFSTGFMIAYRAVTGKTNTTVEQCRTLVNNLDTTKGDSYKALTGAYNFLDSKGTQYSGHGHLCLHFEDTSRTFQYNGETYPVIHASDIEPASGIFWIPMGGAYLYWKMLTYAGVECTFKEALGDTSGNMTNDIPVSVVNLSSSGNIGERIATCMAQIAYTNMDDARADYRTAFKARHGKAVYKGASPANIICGTALYKAVHDYCLGDDPSGVHSYYASCDRGACTAIRWAGADDSFPVGACYSQMGYFMKQSKKSDGKWVEVNWQGDERNLQPGDVFMRSDKWEIDNGKNIANINGHIVIYVSSAIAQRVQPSCTALTYTVGHSSYNDRPPALGNYYAHTKGDDLGLTTFRVFRCVRPETASKYQGYVPNIS